MSAEPKVDDIQTLIQERHPDVFVEQEHGPESHDFQEQLEIPRPLEASLELLRKHTQDQRPSNENEVVTTWPTTHYLIRDEQNECQLYDAQIVGTSKYESILAAATTKDSLLRGLLIEALDLQTTTPQPDIKSNSLAQNLSEFGVAVDPESLQDNERLTAHVVNEDGTSVSTIEIPPFAIQSAEDVEREEMPKKEVESVSYRVQLMRTEEGFVFYQDGAPLAGVDQGDPRVQVAIDQLLQSGQATDTEDIESAGISIQTTYHCLGDPNGLAVGESIDVDINSIINQLLHVEPEDLDDPIEQGIESDDDENPEAAMPTTASSTPLIPRDESRRDVVPQKFMWLLDIAQSNESVVTNIEKHDSTPITTTKLANENTPHWQPAPLSPIHLTTGTNLNILGHLERENEELVDYPDEGLLLETIVVFPTTPPIELIQTRSVVTNPNDGNVESTISMDISTRSIEFTPQIVQLEPISYPKRFSKQPIISITEPVIAQLSTPREHKLHLPRATHDAPISPKRVIQNNPVPRKPDYLSFDKPRRATKNRIMTTAQNITVASSIIRLESNTHNANVKVITDSEKQVRQSTSSQIGSKNTNVKQILHANADRKIESSSERKVTSKTSARKTTHSGEYSKPIAQTNITIRRSQTPKLHHNNQVHAIALPVSSQDSVRSVLQQSLGQDITINGEHDEPILREQIRPLGILCEEVTRLLPKYPSINISVSIGYRTVDILPTSDQPLDRLQFIQELQSLSIPLSIDQHLTCHYRLGSVQ